MTITLNTLLSNETPEAPQLEDTSNIILEFSDLLLESSELDSDIYSYKSADSIISLESEFSNRLMTIGNKIVDIIRKLAIFVVNLIAKVSLFIASPVIIIADWVKTKKLSAALDTFRSRLIHVDIKIIEKFEVESPQITSIRNSYYDQLYNIAEKQLSSGIELSNFLKEALQMVENLEVGSVAEEIKTNPSYPRLAEIKSLIDESETKISNERASYAKSPDDVQNIIEELCKMVSKKKMTKNVLNNLKITILEIDKIISSNKPNMARLPSRHKQFIVEYLTGAKDVINSLGKLSIADNLVARKLEAMIKSTQREL